MTGTRRAAWERRRCVGVPNHALRRFIQLMPKRSDRDARGAVAGALGRSEAATVSTVDLPLRNRCRPHRLGVPERGTPFHYTAYQNRTVKRSIKRCGEREMHETGSDCAGQEIYPSRQERKKSRRNPVVTSPMTSRSWTAYRFPSEQTLGQ